MEASEIVSQSTTIGAKDDIIDDVKSPENSPGFKGETSMELVNPIIANTAFNTKENVDVTDNTDVKDVEVEMEESQNENGLETQSVLPNERSGAVVELSDEISKTGEHTKSAEMMENNLAISHQTDGRCVVPNEINKFLVLSNDETNGNLAVGIESSRVESTMVGTNNSPMYEATVDTRSVSLVDIEMEECQNEKGKTIETQSVLPNERSGAVMELNDEISKTGEHTKSAEMMENNLAIPHQTDVPNEINKTVLSNYETNSNLAVGIESSRVESTMVGTNNSPMYEATVDTHSVSLVDIEMEECQNEKGTIETQSVLPNELSGAVVELNDQISKTGEHTESAEITENNLAISKDKDEESVKTRVAKKVQAQAPVTSLSVIAAAYDTSDSESEEPDCIGVDKNNCMDENEKEVQITKEYRNMTIIETSDEDSDSDDSSSAAESSLSSDTDNDKSDDSSDDDERTNDSKKKNERNRRQKGSHEKELKGEFDNLPPIEDLKISVPEVLCDPLGEVGWMVEQMVVVRPKAGKPTLNLDTMLFVERGRRVLGRIFDVFGQVSEPHYCVRFNSTEHIKESDIKVGMTVYFCPNTEYTSVVFLQDLLKMKVTDELGDDEHPEFSDDEEERAYYAALKQKQKNEKAKSGGEVPQKRQRMAAQGPTWKSNHPWSTSRMHQQPGKTYNTPEWSDSSQQNACQPANLWQYPSAYPNNPWSTAPETYQGNAWPAACPQNAYGYSEQFGNRHPRPNARPFFRPHQSFQPGHNPYAQNRPYAQQSNSPRYPGANFPWRSQSPRQPGMTWSLPPPPPPPPPGL